MEKNQGPQLTAPSELPVKLHLTPCIPVISITAVLLVKLSDNCSHSLSHLTPLGAEEIPMKDNALLF